MNDRERFLLTMHFKKPDRLPIYEWCGYWPATIERWHKEGLPPGSHPRDYFRFDRRRFVHIPLGPLPRLKRKIIEENTRYRIVIDSLGVVKKYIKDSLHQRPQFIDFPLRTPEDFEKLKSRFDPDDPRRFPAKWSRNIINTEKVPYPVGVSFRLPFTVTRDLMGLERVLISFYKEADFIHELFSFWTDYFIKVIKKSFTKVKVKMDFANVGDSIGMRNGPFVSLRIFEEFFIPYYKIFVNCLKEIGIDVIMYSSDGDITLLVPFLLKLGFNCIHHLEKMAGMDALSLREQYGEKLALIGNVDKMALIKSKVAIREEVERKWPIAKEGGYIYSVDHWVPPEVSFENYTYYVNLVKKISNKI